jgi:hypothetical protein
MPHKLSATPQPGPASPAPVDLGAVQSNLLTATATLKTAQRNKLLADEAYTRALEEHGRAKASLNAAVGALKSLAAVENLDAA